MVVNQCRATVDCGTVILSCTVYSWDPVRFVVGFPGNLNALIEGGRKLTADSHSSSSGD